jgi:hypothetical protein
MGTGRLGRYAVGGCSPGKTGKDLATHGLALLRLGAHMERS